jgi:hypothetical protein
MPSTRTDAAAAHFHPGLIEASFAFASRRSPHRLGGSFGAVLVRSLWGR